MAEGATEQADQTGGHPAATWLRVKNWKAFQHYDKRSPPWIKLHRGLLEDMVFQSLPDASRALAPCLWLLASDSKEGAIKFDPTNTKELAWRLRKPDKWLEAAIQPLIESGFFILCYRDASGMLADCLQGATSETERETETEREREARDSKKVEGKSPEPDEDFLTELKTKPKYKRFHHLDVDGLAISAEAWARDNGRAFSRLFLVNWLNKEAKKPQPFTMTAAKLGVMRCKQRGKKNPHDRFLSDCGAITYQPPTGWPVAAAPLCEHHYTAWLKAAGHTVNAQPTKPTTQHGEKIDADKLLTTQTATA